MTITVKSGFWNDTYSFISGGHPLESRIKNLMRRRGMKTLQELSVTLLGAVAGSTASGTYKQVVNNGATNGSPTPLGGLGGIRLTQTRTQLSRATLDADTTRITNLFTKSKLHTSVSDRSGNGK